MYPRLCGPWGMGSPSVNRLTSGTFQLNSAPRLVAGGSHRRETSRDVFFAELAEVQRLAVGSFSAERFEVLISLRRTHKTYAAYPIWAVWLSLADP